MNWRAVAFIVIASALLQAVAAATPVQRPLAVVHPLQALGRVDRFLLKALGEEVRTALLKTGAYRLLDSSALERGLKGLTACRKGAHARSCHLAAGRFLSASRSITGMVTRLSDRTHYLSLVVVDLHSGLELRRASVMSRGSEHKKFLSAVGDVVAELVKTPVLAACLTTGTGSGPPGAEKNNPLPTEKIVLWPHRLKMQRSWLGLMVQPLTKLMARSFGLARTRGALIAQVIPRSPAHQAGLKAGEIILKFGDREIQSVSNLVGAAKRAIMGVPLKVVVWRRSGVTIVRLIPGSFKEYRSLSQRDYRLFRHQVSGLDLTVANLTWKMARQLEMERIHGVVVLKVKARSAAYIAGIRINDIILSLDFNRIGSTMDFFRAMKKIRPGSAVSLHIRRGKIYFWTALVKK